MSVSRGSYYQPKVLDDTSVLREILRPPLLTCKSSGRGPSLRFFARDGHPSGMADFRIKSGLRKTMLNFAARFEKTIAGEGLEKGSPEENVDQMPFVFGAAFVIVDQLRAIGDESSSLRQAFFDIGTRAREQFLGRGRAAGRWADAADGDTGRGKRAAAIRSFEPQSQAERGALMNLKLHVSSAVIRFRARDDDPRENFAWREMIRISSGNEVLDGDFASACGAFDAYFCVEDEQHRGGVRVRLGKAKIASEGSRRPHSNIGHLRFQFRQYGLLFAHQRGAFDSAMRAGGANFDYTIARLDGVQCRNDFEVDEVAIAERQMPHGQQQFRPARVDGPVLAIVPEHLRRFRDALWLMDFKTRERGHTLVLGARALCDRVLGARSFLAKGEFLRIAGACAFFSCSAFHTRSGVNGRLRMRTPAA